MSPSSSAADRTKPTGSTPDTYVAAWDKTGSDAFTAAALTPPEGHVIFAYAAIAVYDSVLAVKHGYQPFAIRANAPRGTSAEAAVAAAAHRIYAHYLPDQAPTILDPAFEASKATIPDGKAKDDGLALGERVANALIALRADDGFRAAVDVDDEAPFLPGEWVPTAPASVPPAGTYLGRMRPFVLESSDQFHPPGPPSLGSRKWARDYNEVKKIGAVDSDTRTEEQTQAALFWAEPPVQQGHAALRGVVEDRGLDIAQASRMMAMVSVGYADAIIACFEAKYAHNFWRPVTAIRAGDTDGNDATVADPAWSHLLPATPNHPDYPSAHSCVTPAGTQMLAAFLGTRRINLTMPSIGTLEDRYFPTVRALTTEVSNARVWGGIHFRSAVTDGVRIGQQTAKEILKHHFQRVR